MRYYVLTAYSAYGQEIWRQRVGENKAYAAFKIEQKNTVAREIRLTRKGQNVISARYFRGAWHTLVGSFWEE